MVVRVIGAVMLGMRTAAFAVEGEGDFVWRRAA